MSEAEPSTVPISTHSFLLKNALFNGPPELVPQPFSIGDG